MRGAQECLRPFSSVVRVLSPMFFTARPPEQDVEGGTARIQPAGAWRSSESKGWVVPTTSFGLNLEGCQVVAVYL